MANLPNARLTMDTLHDRAIILHVGEQSICFQECSEGLYFVDVGTLNHKHSNDSLNAYSNTSIPHSQFITTVTQNSQHYTKREIQGARASRALQESIGWPSTQFFKEILINNYIKNSSITSTDVNNAEDIFGPPLPLLKGNKTRKRPQAHTPYKTPLPLDIKERHRALDLYVDFFFVNKLPFLHTKSQHLSFITSNYTGNRTKSTIIRYIGKIVRMYRKRGFEINFIHGDNEFQLEDLETAISPSSLEIYAPEEHVPNIERSVRTVKEKCRALTHSVPYERYTKLMTVALIENATYWLNAFPNNSGIVGNISPSQIVQGHPAPDYNTKRIPFGSYALVYTKTTNTMEARSVPAVALHPSNQSGGHFLCPCGVGEKSMHMNGKNYP